MNARTLIRTAKKAGDKRAKGSTKGVSLIEMMFAVAMIGVLLGIALPMLKQPIQNYRIKSQTESVLNALKLARSTAIQRNENIRFELTQPGNTSPLEWSIKAERDGTLIQSNSISYDTSTLAYSTQPSNATALTFDGLGSVVAAGKSSTIQTINVVIRSPIITAAESKDLSIRIHPAGTIRMCDPNVTNPNAIAFCA